MAYAKTRVLIVHRWFSWKDFGLAESNCEQAVPATTFLPDGPGRHARSVCGLLSLSVQTVLPRVRNVLCRLHPRASPGQVSASRGCGCDVCGADSRRGWLCCSA